MMPKLAGFDMDGTLIQGRLVFAVADMFGLSDKVRAVQASGALGYEQTQAIAGLFAGVAKKDIETAIESIPLTTNCEQTIAELKSRNYNIGIISDSYAIAAQNVADRLELDFVAANDLRIENGMATGKVEMPLGWDKINCFCKISVCKRYHLEKFAHQFNVPIENTLAVGDTRSDMCMIKRAKVGIAFMPKDDEIAKATDKIIRNSDLVKVLEYSF